MNPEFDLFISLSAIAGIFIGFGARQNSLDTNSICY
jgi:hypothetical protein